MTPRRLLREALLPLDAFDKASTRSVGAQRPSWPVEFK
jgi:hypothetical protein